MLHFFFNLVTEKRIAATKSGDDALQNAWKLVGNSCYGRLGMNLLKHEQIYYRKEDRLMYDVRSPLYKRHEPIVHTKERQIYEVVKSKRKIEDKVPVTAAFFILSHAKLHVLKVA